MYFDYDLTASKSEYKVTNDLYTIYEVDQRIEFDIPVFFDTLRIYKVDDIAKPLDDSNTSALVPNLEFTYEERDIDKTTTARIKLADNKFNQVLVKAIKITKAYQGEYVINLKYNQLYPVNINSTLISGNRLEVTPELVATMLEKIHYLDLVNSGIQTVHSNEDGTPRILELDLHMDKPENKINKEIHEVNVPDNRNVIYPLAGSFFKGTEVLFIEGNTDPLIPNVEYIVFGEDLHKNRMTPVKHGVYNFIMILKEYVGKVFVDYHAFGGEPTLYDIKELNKRTNDLNFYLTSNAFITNDTIGNLPLIKTFADKITELEKEMRILLKGKPTYGDTHSKTILKRVRSIDDALHWTTIASLYKVEGSDDVVITDRLHIRVQTLKSKLMFDAMVSVNLAADNETEQFHVNILSENTRNGSKSVDPHIDLSKEIRPMFRILWNKDITQSSGILLQIGFEYKDIAEETIVVEDNSGRESCWKLVEVQDIVYNPEDNVLQLPNENHIWDDTNVISEQLTQLIPFNNGYLIWKGVYPTNVPNGGTISKEFNHFLPANVKLRDYTKIRVEFNESGFRSFFVDIPVSYNGTDGIYGLGNFHYNDIPGYIAIRVFDDAISGKKKMQVTTKVDDVISTAAELDIVHIWVYSN